MDGTLHPHSAHCPGLSLVIPAFNEQETIHTAIAEAEAALALLADDFEVLVVDDGSTDETAQAVARCLADHPHTRFIQHEANRGYGAALCSGFEMARFDLVAFTDADCQFHLEDLGLLIERTADAPIAVGYRVDRKDAPLRRFVSWGYNKLVRALLGTRARDCDCALKVFRREALQKLMPESTGFFVNTEMLARARQHGMAIEEAGVRHRPRLDGQSTVSMAEIPKVLSRLIPFWWSKSMFPGTDRKRREPVSSQWSMPLVIGMAILLFFSQLSSPLLEPQEARYAEIPREMLAAGNWMAPTLNGHAYYDKPPLLYWMVMGSYQLFGVSERSARLIPGLFAVLTVCMVYYWGRRTVGPRAGLCSALVLCLSVRFLYLGRMLAFDGPLCFFVVTALAAAHLAIRGPTLRMHYWLISAIAVGLGILTKGPVALVLVLIPVMLIPWLDPRIFRPRLRGWLIFFGVSIGVAAPWFIAMCITDPGFARYFFWEHHVIRFLQPFDHQEPIWFFLPTLLMGMLPWALLLPGMLRFLTRRSRRAASRRPQALGFFLLSFLWGLLFFSLSGCKRPVYILPVLPLLALTMGWYLDTWLPSGGSILTSIWQPLRGTVLARRATLLVLALGSLTGVGGVVVQMIPWNIALLLILPPIPVLILLLRSRQRISWGICSVATFAVLLMGVQVALPEYNRRFALRRCACAQRQEVRQGRATVVCYPQAFSSVSFYLKRPIRTYSAAQRDELIADAKERARTLVFVKSGRSLDGLIRALPSTLVLQPIDRQGKVTVAWLCQRNEMHTKAMAQR